MRLSYNWLRDYVDLDVSPTQLAERLTMVGLEVEELSDRYSYLDSVIVGLIVSVEDHPKADHLKICRVETGEGTVDVVCGAPNVTVGMLSALAKVGTELPGGMQVAESEIRGVRSTGMLCSEAELVVGPDASGILALTSTARPGQSIKKALKLDDWVFELGVTPNRPDCLSIIGVAREVAGLSGGRLKRPVFDLKETGPDINELTSIDILDPDHCPRYAARVILDVKVGPSPFWLADRLYAAGVRPINNIVDITNFVLMEVGQPQHAFDMDTLDERRIVVKTADEGDRFVTLDGVERIMTPDMLMICDGKKSVGLAGVMGGLNSEIVNETKDVLLESAYFNPVTTRRTSKTLGLSTDASFRFERGTDPEICAWAADRAAALMAELAGGTIARGIIDNYPKPHKKRIIPFSPAKCNAFLGTDIGHKRMVAGLAGIELEVSGSGEVLNVEPPSFRVDLERAVDIYEEVARLIGFYQIPATIPAARDEAWSEEPSRPLRTEIRDRLEGMGLSEVVNYSFIEEGFCDRLNLPDDDERRNTVRIINPLSEDQALMRTTLVPGLLDTARRNNSHGVQDVEIYEIGMTFFHRENEDLPDERPAIGGLITGNSSDISWRQKPESVDFYDVKGYVEDLLEGLGVPMPAFERAGLPAYYDRSASARLGIMGQALGCLGRIDDKVAKAFGLRQDAYVFELDMNAILALRKERPRFTQLPRFPFVDRDLAIVLDRETESARVLDYILGMGEDFLTEATIFDAYEGKQLGENKKSLAFRLLYRSKERTLTDEEVNAVHERITARVLKEFSATLRG